MDFPLHKHILEKNRDQLFYERRDGRKFFIYQAKLAYIDTYLTNSFSEWFSGLFGAVLCKIAFPIYVLLTQYSGSYTTDFRPPTIFLLLLVTTYQIQLIQNLALSKDLQFRKKLLKMVQSMIDLSDDSNFVFASEKFPQVEKLDITSKLSLESWNIIRKIAILQ